MAAAVPTCGLIVQLTPCWLIPLTAAVNRWVCPAVNVTVDEGVTRTVTVGGTSEICWLARVPSVAIAVTVTVCRNSTGFGAV